MEIKTDAIVLRAADYKDADKILTLLTPSAGKLTAGIKGVKKSGRAPRVRRAAVLFLRIRSGGKKRQKHGYVRLSARRIFPASHGYHALLCRVRGGGNRGRAFGGGLGKRSAFSLPRRRRSVRLPTAKKTKRPPRRSVRFCSPPFSKRGI